MPAGPTAQISPRRPIRSGGLWLLPVPSSCWPERSPAPRGRVRARGRWRVCCRGAAKRRRLALAVYQLHEQHLLVIVDLAQLDLDNLAAGGRDDAANVFGFNRQFTVAAINQHEQLHALGAAMVKQSIQRGADGAAGVEHVVHQNDVAARYIEANLTLLDNRTAAARGEVVAVEADVEHAGIHRVALNRGDDLGDALGKRNTATLDADEAKVGRAMVARADRMRQAHQGAFDLGGRKQAPLLPHLRCARGGLVFGGGGGSGLDCVAHRELDDTADVRPYAFGRRRRKRPVTPAATVDRKT